MADDKTDDKKPKAAKAEPYPMPEDGPGHPPEPAASSGAAPPDTGDMAPPGQGGQVVLTGDAQAAARGGPHATIEANTAARDEAIIDGHVETPATKEAVAGAVTAQKLPDEDADKPKP